MDSSVYRRPDKRKYALAPGSVEEVDLQLEKRPQPVVVSADTQCHVTPASVAARMVEYLDPHPDSTVLEPSAGTGNLIQALINAGQPDDKIVSVEQNFTLHEVLCDKFACALGAMYQCDFVEWAQGMVEGGCRYPAILMNPPFKPVKQHMKKAVELLGPCGVLVALVPITFEADGFELLEELPMDTFGACKVRTKIVRYEAD